MRRARLSGRFHSAAPRAQRRSGNDARCSADPLHIPESIDVLMEAETATKQISIEQLLNCVSPPSDRLTGMLSSPIQMIRSCQQSICDEELVPVHMPLNDWRAELLQ